VFILCPGGLDGLPEMSGSMDDAMSFVTSQLAGYPTTLTQDFKLLPGKDKVRERRGGKYHPDALGILLL